MSFILILQIAGAIAKATVTKSEGSSPRPAYVLFLMQVTVRLFAAHREAAGTNAYVADLPDGSTVADAFDRVCAEYPAISRTARSVAFALNQTHVSPDARLRDGDEVALLPPVAGG
jgi:molybdopterin converting factor subunit 1